MKLKDTCSLQENLRQPGQHIKKQRNHFADKSPCSQSYGFYSSYVWMWELDHKEGWALKNWCFQIVMPEKTPESPLESKDIKPVNPKGNQLWIYIGRIDAEAPILWPPDWKDFDAGKDWGQEEKGTTEDETVGWYHWLNGHEFEPTQGDSEGQGSLVCWAHGVTGIWHNLATEQQQRFSVHMGKYQGVWLLDHMLRFIRNYQTVFQSASLFCIPTSSEWKVLLLNMLSSNW